MFYNKKWILLNLLTSFLTRYVGKFKTMSQNTSLEEKSNDKITSNRKSDIGK